MHTKNETILSAGDGVHFLHGASQSEKVTEEHRMNGTADIPLIKLDTTLADLYAIGQDVIRPSKLAVVPCGWVNFDLGPNMPGNRRYTLQESFTITKSQDEIDKMEQSPVKQEEVRSKLFALVAQRDSFAAGKMCSIGFIADTSESDEPSQTEVQALKTFESLSESQRPDMLFCRDPSELPDLLKKHDIDELAFKLPIDLCEGLHSSTNYPNWAYLNSKVAIVESGLPTPDTIVFKPDLCETDPNECCKECRNHPHQFGLPDSCTGVRRKWLDEQIERFFSTIRSKPTPFVIKTQQSIGGGGTFILRDKEQKSTFMHNAKARILPKVFGSFSRLNDDLRPAELMICSFVSDIRRNWGLTFFITRDGNPIFLSATEQKLRDDRLWFGSAMDYSQQDKYEEKFKQLMHQITNFVYHEQADNGNRYFGPMGADVLEIASSSENDSAIDSQYLVVDLNVRIPGSCNLGMLRSHFTANREDPLIHATNTLIESTITREDFINMFRHEVCETQSIIITAWYHDAITKTSQVNLVIAAPTLRALEELQERLDKVCFTSVMA